MTRIIHPWHLVRIVIGVDPATTAGENSDDTGIIVAAKGRDGHGYILDDLTCHLSPDGWAKTVRFAYEKWQADRVVVEANQGGEMVRTVLRTQDQNMPLTLVHARDSKRTRAEPVAALYEQGKVHHVGLFAELEDQLCVAGSTLVLTRAGEVPIERVRSGDQVWTRAGWKPVLWAGQTGHAPCMTITLENGRSVRCTTEHPVWVEGHGFRPASEVQSQHRCLFQSPENTSSTTASNTSVPSSHPARSTGAQHESKPTAANPCSCTECSGQSGTARSLTVGTSTTRTRTASTTTVPTWLPSTSLATWLSTPPEVGGATPLSRSALRGRASGLPSSPDRSPASLAAPSSSAPGNDPCSARAVAVAATTPASAATEPVYNLTVADQPEFFANGLLVHNCSWVPGESDSPDRLDALVWALTDLMVGSSGNVPADYEFFAAKPGPSKHALS